MFILQLRSVITPAELLTALVLIHNEAIFCLSLLKKSGVTLYPPNAHLDEQGCCLLAV